MDALRWDRRPTLRRPVLLAAFEGWNDAGDAATTALAHLAERWKAQPFAEIDPEEFYDFTSARPEVKLVEGIRRIQWPSARFVAGPVPGTGRDAVLLVGVEPQLKWRTFCGHLIEVARGCGVELVLTLGALLADVPHSRPVRVSGSSTDPAVISRLGVARSRYEGPTGIVGVLHDFLAEAGIPSASLWAAVPHYLPGTPSPKAALALVEQTASLLGTSVPLLDLQIAAAQYERQVNDVVDADEDMARYVRQLELGIVDEDDDEDDEDHDEDDDGREQATSPGPLVDEHGNVPSGDALAAELEQFLRDQDKG